MEYIQINESNRDTILQLFNRSVDDEGYIVESKTNKKIKCPYTKEFIKANDFSILPGSATFVNNKYFCFSEHIASHLR